MSIDLQMVDLDALIAEYNRLTDALATAQAERDAAVRALADEQARVVTLRRQVQAMEFAETTVTAHDPVKAALVGYLTQHRARLVTWMSEDMRSHEWIDQAIADIANGIVGRDAPDEAFEPMCAEIDKRMYWVALVSVVMDGDVVFRALSNAVSFSEE